MVFFKISSKKVFPKKRSEPIYLSDRVALAIGKSRFFIFKSFINNIDLSYPSKGSIITLGSFVIVWYLLMGFLYNWKFCWKISDSNYYQNFLTIHAGIGAIIFSLVILIAESLRDKASDQGSVLLKKSGLFQLTVIELLVFLTYIYWPAPPVLHIIPIAVICFLSIKAVATIMRLFINKKYYQQERTKYLIDRMNKAIVHSLEERIGKILLIEAMKDCDIEYNPYHIDETNGYCFSTTKEGIIEDINMSKLKSFVALVKAQFQENLLFADNTLDEPVLPTKSFVKCEIRAMFRQKLTSHSKTALFIVYPQNQHSVEELTEKLDALRGMMSSIFVIKKKANFNDEVRFDLSTLKEECSDALRANQHGKVEILCQTYSDIVHGYLQWMKERNGLLSFSESIQERHSIFYDSYRDTLGWLSNDFKYLLGTAIRTNSQDLIFCVVRCINTIISISIETGDHFLFQQFANTQLDLYGFASDEKLSINISDSLKRLSYGNLTNYMTYDIVNTLDHKLISSDDMVNHYGYGLFIIKKYQDLLKWACTRGDTDYFTSCLKSLEEALSFKMRFDRADDESYITPNDLREKIIKGQNIKEKKIIIKKEWELLKNQMLFGFAAWLLNKILNGQKERFQFYYDAIDTIIKSDISTIARLFLLIMQDTNSDYWEWDWWDIEKDSSFQKINTRQNLINYYVYKLTKIMVTYTVDQINKVDLPFSMYSQEVSNDKDILPRLKKNKLVHKLTSTRINQICKVFSKATENYEVQRKKEVREALINVVNINEFKNSFLQAFTESTIIRGWISKKATIDIMKSPNEDSFGMPVIRVGINVLEDKTTFIENNRFSPKDLGHHKGTYLALQEDYYLLKRIHSHCKKITLNNFDEIATQPGITDKHVCFLSGPQNLSLLNQIDNYEDDYNSNYASYSGYYGSLKVKDFKIPIFYIGLPDMNSKVLIINNQLGLKQFLLDNETEEGNNCLDQVNINIISYSENIQKTTEILEAKPDWLIKIGDETRQKEYLYEQVAIRIFEHFQIVEKENFLGYSINIIPEAGVKGE